MLLIRSRHYIEILRERKRHHSVDARLRHEGDVCHLHSPANHDGDGACDGEFTQVINTFRDDGAVGCESAVALGGRFVQRTNAQVVRKAHVRGFHVLKHLVRACGETHDCIGAEELAARFNGNVGLPDVHAVDLHARLPRGESHVEPVVDEQRDLLARARALDGACCLAGASYELARRAHLRAHLHAGEPGCKCC